MSSVDQRVVDMKFNSTAFAKGIADTLAALTRLQDGLKLNGASRGAQEAATGIDELGQKTGLLGGQFTAMQAMAFGALASIGAKAVQVGTQVAKSLTIAPIMQGFQEYETNMNSIQTILANTKQAGTGLTEVNAALDEMNHYSDKTIYNFSEMAKNVGTFTAAGVELDTATGSIKGIANLAALSGSNSQQAAGAMYQLSQEIAAGKVTLMGWNSVVNAGMGGSVFQRALAETAVAMGKIDQGALKLDGKMKNVTINGKAFRDSISAEGGNESWLTSDVLTNTLQQFTGDLSDAELAAQGFSAAQIQSIKDTATMAVGAATEVKTLTGLMDTLKEGVASGWSQSFRILIGDFEEAKTLFTGISNAVGGWLGRMADSRNELLQGWKDLGGRTVLIEGLTEAFWALGSPLATVGQAFRQIFPRTTAQDLYNFTVAFRDFMLDLQPAPETMDRLRRTFAGLFAVLGIGWEIVKAVAKFLLDMFRGVEEGDKGILRITATIGDWLVALHAAVKNGEGLTKFFDGLKTVLFAIINPIKDAAQWLGKLFESDSGGAADSMSALASSLEPIAGVGKRIQSVWGSLGEIFNSVRTIIGNFVSQVGEFFSTLGGHFDSGFEFNADTIIQALQTVLGAGLLAALMGIKTAISNFDLFGGAGQGMLETIQETLGGVNDVLGAMQANLRANALIKIAGAIAILAAAVFVLAGIDGPGLVRATSALTVMFIQLGVAMKVLEGIGTIAGAVKLTILGFALIFLATAILILTAAVKKLSEIGNLGDMLRGLLGLTIILRILTTAVQNMSGQAAGMIRTGAGLILLAVAIKILVSAVKDLSELDWNELAKGLVGVGVLLGALTLFTRLAKLDKIGVSSGLGLILLGIGLKVLASAVKDFAVMSWEDLAKGLGAVAVGLGAIALALRLMPESSLLQAAAILIVATSLKMIADAIESMEDMRWQDMVQGVGALAGALIAIAVALKLLPPSSLLSAAAIFVVASSLSMIADALEQAGQMTWEEVGKGLVVLAGSLMIIAVAMKFMTTALAGAVATFVVAAALGMLLPVLQAFGEMTWEEIAKGLGTLAGVFLILGVAGLVLAPIVPVLFGLGASIALLGIAVMLAGAGVFLFATGLTLLAAAGAGATAAIVAIVSGLIGLIPLVMEQIGLGIIAFAMVIATAGPAILAAITTVLLAFLQAIINVTPKVAQTLLVMLNTMLIVLVNAIPRLVEAGMRIIIGFLTGIANNIGKVVDKATDVIVNFINGISRNLPRIIQAGVDLIISFVNGVADAIRKNSTRMGEAGGNLATAIVEGMVKGMGAGLGKIVTAAKNLASSALNAAKDFLGINSPSKEFMIQVGKPIAQGAAIGIDKYGYLAENSTVAMGKNLLDAMGKTISGLGAMVNEMDEFNPVITPVLDLSAVQRGSAKIGNLLSAAPIDLRDAMANAGDASAGYAANLEALAEAVAANSGVTQSFTQNNYSPKSLSQAEIYRQTNNQLSMAKGALTNAN